MLRVRAGGAVPGAELLQHVVEAGEADMRVFRQYPLAVCVEVFGKGADALLLQVVGGGEGEGVETARFGIARIDLPASRLARSAHATWTRR